MSVLGPRPAASFDELCLRVGRWKWCGDDLPHLVHPTDARLFCPGTLEESDGQR